MIRILQNIILFSVLVCGSEIIFAQPFPELRFKHLTTKDGLTDNRITCISEDKNGFIWFSTINGLNRFDGYRIKQFFHKESDSFSLPGNNISQIAADSQNNLWIATSNGLAYFDMKSQKSLNFTHEFINSPSLVSSQSANIFLENNKKPWATAGESLFGFDADFHYYKIPEGVDSFQFKNKKIGFYHSITADKKNRLWAFSINRIFSIDANSKKIVKTFIGPEQINIYRIYFDSDNRCWLATRANGLYLFDPEENKWESVNTGSKGLSGCLSEWRINSKKYIVYISESNVGLVVIDEKTLAFRCYKDYAFANPMLDDDGVSYVYTDSKNILWIGTQNGISYVTPTSLLFDVIPIGTDDHLPDFSKQKVVFDIYHDMTGYWLSKWYLGGLFHYSKNWEADKYLPALYPLTSKSPNLTSMSFSTKSYGKKIYMTTDSGLIELDTSTLHTKIFQPDNATYGTTLRTIIPVSDTLWWIQSYYFGIYVFDVVQKKFIKHYGNSQTCANCLPEKIVEIFKSNEDNIYICSYNGLFEYRQATDDFINYRKDAKNKFNFPGDSLYAITEDKKKKLWIGTNKGICVFNQSTKKVEKVFPENELIGAVNALCTDKWNNIWLATSTGPWCRLAGSGRFINFNNDKEMPENSGDGVLAALDDGNVYDGGLDAVVKFNPELLQEYSGFKPISVITEASVANNFIPLYGNGEKRMDVARGTHLFTVDFTLLNYNFVSSNRYFYRLLPLSNTWQQNSNGHLSFYDVPPGKYQLEVKGDNEFDRIFSEIDSLVIEVKPQWWQTWWLKLLSIVFIAAIVFLIARRRIISIRKESAVLQQQSALKQKIAETEMQALRAQMNPHFIFNCLNSIENFMMKNDKRMASDYFSKFASLIRMILDNSRNELVPFSKDMEALQLYVELEQLRFDNKFSYQTVIEPALLNEDYNVPPLLIQPFVENAIIHGLSQSDKEKLRILVTAVVEGDYIIYTVQDNGIGRRRSQEYNQQKKKHTSLGMSITQERIDILNQQQQDMGKFTITDLYDDNGEPDGTKVEIKFKAI